MEHKVAFELEVGVVAGDSLSPDCVDFERVVETRLKVRIVDGESGEG